MNMNQCAHAKIDLYAEIAKLRKQKNKIIKALMASWLFSVFVIAALIYWSTRSIVIG